MRALNCGARIGRLRSTPGTPGLPIMRIASRFPTPGRALPALALVCAVTACSTPLNEPVSGRTCCNLRVSRGWISSNNTLGGSFIPAGEAVTIDTIKRDYYAYGTLAGESYGFRDDSAKSAGDTLAWLHRIVVSHDPRARLAAWPPEVRAAVSAGRVLRGMSREQVAMALGYPSPNDTRDLDGPVWRYWSTEDDSPLELEFTANGTLSKVTGSTAGQALVVYQP